MKLKRSKNIPLVKRSLKLAAFVIALLALIVIKFYRLQVIEGPKWAAQAAAQHELILKEPFERGKIYANTSLQPFHPQKPQPLVFDVPYFHLYSDPLSVPQELREEVAAKLSKITLEEKKDLEQQLAKNSRYRKLHKWLSSKEKEAIEAWWFPFQRKHKIPRNALFFLHDYKRSYPFGSLLGPLLHTVRDERDPNTGQAIPTGGLELQFHQHLKGKCGKRRLLRTLKNPLETTTLIEPAQDGSDLYLTINHHIQAVAERELEKGVIRAQAKSGWAVVVDPYTGQIYALAQYPFFSPSHYREYYNDPEKLKHTSLYAATYAPEPGSILKPINMAICLEANALLQEQGEAPLFDPEEKVATGSGRFPGRSKDLKDTYPASYLNFDMAMKHSSNIYMAKIIDRLITRLGNDYYRSALKNFGFEEHSGAQLPGEATPSLPTPGKLHPNGSLEWSLSTPTSLCLGHNIQLNSLQIARAYCAIANGGRLPKLSLIKKIVKKGHDGQEEVIDFEAQSKYENFPRVLSKKSSARLIEALKYVTKKGGSSTLADVYGYSEAGKSGTAEKVINGVYDKTKNVSSFVGLVPAQNPRLVILVSIDEPKPIFVPGFGRMQYGGKCAAPIFREIAKFTLDYVAENYDDPHGYPPGDPRYIQEAADWSAQTEQLQEKYKKWNSH